LIFRLTFEKGLAVSALRPLLSLNTVGCSGKSPKIYSEIYKSCDILTHAVSDIFILFTLFLLTTLISLFYYRYRLHTINKDRPVPIGYPHEKLKTGHKVLGILGESIGVEYTAAAFYALSLRLSLVSAMTILFLPAGMKGILQVSQATGMGIIMMMGVVGVVIARGGYRLRAYRAKKDRERLQTNILNSNPRYPGPVTLPTLQRL
jgi:hypothetical protein